MLHASETWPLTKTNLQRLQRNDRAMIRQICRIKPEEVAMVRSSKLLAKLELENLDLILRREGFAGLPGNGTSSNVMIKLGVPIWICSNEMIN